MCVVRGAGWVIEWFEFVSNKIISRHPPPHDQALEHASEALKGDKEIVTAAVNQNGKSLKHASEVLRADRNIVMAAVVHSDGMPYQFASEALRGDKEIVTAAYVRCFEAKYASEELKSDEKFLESELRLAVNRFNESQKEKEKEARKNQAVNESGATAQLTLAAKPIPFELTNLVLKGAATQVGHHAVSRCLWPIISSKHE